MENVIKTEYVKWNWEAWRAEFDGVVLKVGMRFTAKGFDFEEYQPEWIKVEVVEDKGGKLRFVGIHNGLLYDLQEMPLLCVNNE